MSTNRPTEITLRPTRPHGRVRRRRISGTFSTEPPPEAPQAPSAEELREQLLEQIAQGGRLCREIEAQLSQSPGPELEVLIKLFRVLVLKACGEAQAGPERLAFFSALMKAILEWGRLEEKRKQRELTEQKYRDEVSAREKAKTSEPKVLTPETLKRIERELKLF